MNVLLIYKKSVLHIYGRERRDPHFLGLMRRKDPAVALVERSHREHMAALKSVEAALRAAGCRIRCAYRALVGDTQGYDLVISVGGDGTLLEAARTVVETPILGVNSAPSSSVGFYSGATAETFPKLLRQFLAGRAPESRLTRLTVAVNGHAWRFPVLNDVLFTHAVPAATSRYLITQDGVTEEHRSSGIWFCTASGSTAAMRSAGGRQMPLGSRRVQYRVREPFYFGVKPRLLSGFLAPGENIEVRSKMRTATVYMDGPHLRRSVQLGDVVTVMAGGPVVRIVGFDEHRRREFFERARMAARRG